MPSTAEMKAVIFAHAPGSRGIVNSGVTLRPSCTRWRLFQMVEVMTFSGIEKMNSDTFLPGPDSPGKEHPGSVLITGVVKAEGFPAAVCHRWTTYLRTVGVIV